MTESSHAHHVKQQLPELKKEAFIIEPGRRGTANCIVAALSYIGKRHDRDEPIAFLAADHYIRDSAGFVNSFKIAGLISRKEAKIVLVGVEPTYPATGFGYIKKGTALSGNGLVYGVDSFKEKPDYKQANEYFKSGDYLWNCGYFVGSIETFVSAMRQFAPSLLKNYQALEHASSVPEFNKTYLGFKSDAIDYALIEKDRELLVVPAAFDWMDLGTFTDLHKAVESNEKGNHLHGDLVEIEQVDNSFIRNHEDKPVAVIGLDNIVVINTKDGLLIARKDLAQQVGEVSKRFKSKAKQ